MGGRLGPLLGSFIFFWIAPGTVAGWVPYALSKWRIQPPLLGVPGERAVGVVVAAVGAAILVACFSRFAIEGRGTPAPIAPTERLVVSGLYRHVRNPMYVAVLAIIAGQALLFGSAVLLGYDGVVWLFFHGFVFLYEEPTLRRKFGPSYDVYRANVRRWWPRIKPWRNRTGPAQALPALVCIERLLNRIEIEAVVGREVLILGCDYGQRGLRRDPALIPSDLQKSTFSGNAKNGKILGNQI